MVRDNASDSSRVPSESRQSSKSSSEMRKTENEMQEVKNVPSGRYEKKTRETETFESRSRSSESYESGILPPGEGDNSGGGNDSGGGNGPGGGGADWHHRVPRQVRISLEGVRPAGNTDAELLSGDYILDLEHRSSLQCRWKLAFPQRCGLDHLVFMATPDADGQLELRVFFTGLVRGPAWTADAPELDSHLLSFDHATAANPSAGCMWPESLLVTALGAQARQQPFYISPEPTAAELAAMSAFALSGSSSGGPSPGDKPGPGDGEPPCEGDECECSPAGGSGGGWSGGGCEGGSCEGVDYSAEPVRYLNGELQLAVTDQSASGFGDFWQHRRSYSNQLSHNYDFGNGFNWQVRQWAYLLESSSGVITVVRGTGGNLWFDPDGAGGYVGRYGAKSILTHDAASGLFLLRSPSGTEDAFHDFDQLTYPPGLFARHTNAGGQATEVTAYTLDDRIGEIQRSLTSGGSTTTESFQYEYFTAGEQADRLQYLTLRRQVGSGAWENIGRTEYEYYGSSELHGSLGDLKRVRQQEFDGTAWQDRDVHYYRYWKAGEANGFEHGLKYVLEPESYALLAAVTNPLTASDGQVAQYANYYYEFDAQRRVAKETVQAGALSYAFAYTTSSHADAYNNWKRKTIETRPDGSQQIVYLNYIGQVLVKELASGTDRWIEYRRYDSGGRLIEHAQPSAVTGYSDSFANLNVSLKAADGLIRVTEYYTTTGSGAVAGYVKAETLQQGSGGTPVLQRQLEYASHSAAGTTVHPVSKETVYRNEDGTGAIETSYSYTFHSGTVRVQQRLTTLPAVPLSQNGSGTSATRTERFDIYGNPTWTRDERGFITRQKYDSVIAALTQRIEDVDTSQTTDEPTGWATPIGGGLHLVSDYEHDSRGRMTQELGPAHTIDIAGTATSIRRATWYVHADLEHETRTGQGYYDVSAATYTLINPVSITKRNRQGQVLEEIRAVRATTSGKLSSSDSFAQLDYVRWTTYQYSDCCTLVSQRVYHTIPSTGGGTAGTNYDQTQFGYDSMKRQNRTVSRGGTIRFDVFDVRGQVIKSYVGTNDSGATETDPTGGGAIGNDMVLVSENQYDGGTAGGDGNLTRQTQHVDALTTRVTSYAYDWRNRQTDTDGELDFFQRQYYDNLGRVTKTERYKTTSAGNLVSREETKFDERGRTYQRIRYAVDRATGLVTGSQTQDFTNDEANNLLRQEPAGSMDYQEFTYDSLGRRKSQSDPLSNSRRFAYDAASNMTSLTDQNNQVWTRGYDALGRLVRSTNPLNQSTTYGYSAAGEQTTIANALGETTTSSFDDAGRLVSVGDPLGRVTSYAYDANGNQTSVTDPNNLTTVSEYDYRDRLVKTTDPAGHATQYAYNRAGERLVETDAKGQSTTHTYDALGRRISTTDRLNQTTTFSWNVLGLQESLTDAESQTTTYVYDDYGRLYQTIWPDHVSGTLPGNADYGITQSEYDALNRVSRSTDQLGDTVTHNYDAAGRLLSRDYRTRINSPSGTIADSDTFTYDASSRMLTAASGRYSNTVTYTYDSAGRKSTESLTISGQTYTSTSQYDAAGRVSKLIYPDASELTRTYTARGQLHTLAAGLTTIDTRGYDNGGRLTSSSYNNGVSESRTYNNDNTLASISFSGASIGTYSYSWDANQNKTSESIMGTMSGYGFSVGASGYDAEDRLVNWQRSDTNLDQAWNLSAVGDWNSITENASTQNRTHGAAHELLTAASQSVQHDAKGNMTLIPAVLRSGSNPLTMKWDFGNRLASADTDADGIDDVFYKWDALGRRIGRDDGTTNTVFFQDGQQTIADYSSGAVASSPTYTYIYGSYIDEPVVRTDSSGGKLYYHRNQQYSIVALTDGVGTISERYAYDAYGKLTVLDGGGTVLSTSAYENRYTYTGREWDGELGLYHYRARMYDPVAGRFVSRDPIGFRGSKWLLYKYADASPALFTDPFGLHAVLCRRSRIPLGELIIHCEYVEQCTPGWERDPVYGWIQNTCFVAWRDWSGTRTLEDGTPCGCASDVDIADCIIANPGGRALASRPGSNCQSDTIQTLSRCCLQSSWQPHWFAGPRRTCKKGHYEWRTTHRRPPVFVCDEYWPAWQCPAPPPEVLEFDPPPYSPPWEPSPNDPGPPIIDLPMF